MEKKLSEYIEAYRIDRPDEWTMDEFVRKAAKLEAERDALAAQVEALKAAIDGVRKVGKTSGFGVPSPASVRAERLAWLRLAEVVELSPQHHLRQVRADAGRDGFVACIRLAYGLQHPPGTTHADQYADSILAGKE